MTHSGMPTRGAVTDGRSRGLCLRDARLLNQLLQLCETGSVFTGIMLSALPLIMLFAADTDPERSIRQKLNISASEKQLLHQGKAIAREVPTNDRAEILVFGAVYIN